ncbi:50S ribosomal protein L29 [Candidatus Gracilibacteria bacterium]|nr:50S ribosomal protein L29 [Candidatus Gracilibacteria bacterium]
MPTKKTTKPVAKKEAAPKKSGDLKTLRGELFSLKMKHALRELKEVHKLKQARRAVARHLTNLKTK